MAKGQSKVVAELSTAGRQLKVVGKSVPILEAREKITGRAKYVEDMEAELFVKILASPHPHAMVKNIDTRAVEELDGVEAILTCRNAPDKLLQFGSHRFCLAMDQHLRYAGDYVAAVAAGSEALAEEALERIEVEYEVLPAVFDPEEALKPDAPKLFEEGNDYGASKGLPFWAEYPRGIQEWGDVDQGFNEADVIVEDRVDVTPQTHAALETYVCMAGWKENELTVWNATQTPTELRLMLAQYFEIPVSKVVVLSEYVGGGFGGKYTGRYQFVTCLLSRMAGGKRTRWALTREEATTYARRPRGKLYAKIGAKKDGTMTALDFRGYFDLGAYGNYHGGSNGFHLEGGLLSYKTPNARFEAFDVHTNHFRAECMRSVQMPLLAFAIEPVVEKLAEKLGMDPIELRLKNMPRTGDMMPPTEYKQNAGFYPTARLDLYPGEQLMQEVLKKIDWKKKWKGLGKPCSIYGPKRRAVGLAYCMGYCGFTFDGGTSVRVVIDIDGSATIYAGSQEIGQGINTTLCMLAAESLGIALEDVSIVTGDTRSGAFDLYAARSSHQLTTDGHLLLEAIEDAKRQVRELAAPMLGVAPKEVEVNGGKCHVKGNPEGAMDLLDICGPFSPPIEGKAAGAPMSIYPEVKPGFKAKQPMIMAAEVEVDMETGAVTPLKLVSGMFPGRMVNKAVVRGQALGGATQSLGMALWEEIKFDQETCTYLNKDFHDYRIPRALDMPEIDCVLLEAVDEESPPHEGLPYGGRGIGEMSAWGAVAIANAVYNATGVRIRKSPVTAETVWKALSREDLR